MQRRAGELARRSGRTPASVREGELFFRWMVIAVLVFFGLAAISVLATVSLADRPEDRQAYPAILLPFVIPLAIAVRHLVRQKRLEERERHRTGVVGTGSLAARAIYDHPYLTTAVIIVIGFLSSVLAVYLGGG